MLWHLASPKTPTYVKVSLDWVFSIYAIYIEMYAVSFSYERNKQQTITYIQYYIITGLFPILEMNWNVINIIKSELTLYVLKCFAYSAILHGNYKRQIWSRRVTIWPFTDQKSVHQAHCPMYQDAMCHALVVWTKIQIGCPILNTHSITTCDNVLEISL